MLYEILDVDSHGEFIFLCFLMLCILIPAGIAGGLFDDIFWR